MSAGTGIQWTDATWNPVSGCTRVSAGCANCYAVPATHRLAAMGQAKYVDLTVRRDNGRLDFTGDVRLHDDALTVPLRWKKPRRVFVNSMSDLFHDGVPFDFIDRVFAVMALCQRHKFQILTKRPERMAESALVADQVRIIAERDRLRALLVDIASDLEGEPHHYKIVKCIDTALEDTNG